MRIDASGNVGIGTSSPGAPLSFGGGDNREVIRIYDGGGAVVAGVGKYTNEMRFYVPSGNFIAFRYGGASGTETLRIKAEGQVRFVPLASDPSGAEAGDVYYNSTSNKLRVRTNTAWVDLH